MAIFHCYVSSPEGNPQKSDLLRFTTAPGVAAESEGAVRAARCGTLALGWPGRNLPASYDGKIIYSNPP